MNHPVLAIISPLPPTWTGIADYTARLLPHLAEQWKVVVFIGDDDPEPEAVPDGIEVLHARSWAWYHRIATVDRLLLCLGNSQYHMHVPAIVECHGGVVLAHDVRMTALCCLLAAADHDRHMLSALVRQRYGIELARDIAAIEDRAPVRESFAQVRQRLEDANALLLSAVAHGADSVLVHSAVAARLARLELASERIPVSVIPFGHPEVVACPSERASALIATFGMLGPEKQPFLLLDALAAIHRRLPEVRLRFVGVADPTQRTTVEEYARRTGVAASIDFTGRIDASSYRRELAEASVAVQLRGIVNGEASAALADCLAAGVPSVVSNVGSSTELPDGVVVRTRPDIDAYELGETIAALLSDRARRKDLSDAGQRYAQSSSFAVAAEALNRALQAAPAPSL